MSPNPFSLVNGHVTSSGPPYRGELTGEGLRAFTESSAFFQPRTNTRGGAGKHVSVETSGVGADRRAAAHSEARRTRGSGSSTPGEIVAPAGFRNRNYNSRLTPKS